MDKIPRKLDMLFGRKAMVVLLGGPLTVMQLKRRLGRPENANISSTLNTWKKRGLMRLDNGEWSLTPAGLPKAARWSYELKNLNRHPDQLPKTYVPLPQEPAGTSDTVPVEDPPAQRDNAPFPLPSGPDWQREYIALATMAMEALRSRNQSSS